jgi:hypothetical protein
MRFGTNNRKQILKEVAMQTQPTLFYRLDGQSTLPPWEAWYADEHGTAYMRFDNERGILGFASRFGFRAVVAQQPKKD